MRVTVHIPDDVGAEVERFANEQGVSVSSLYAEAAEAYLKDLKRKHAFSVINELIGRTEIAADFDEQLKEIRKDDTERL